MCSRNEAQDEYWERQRNAARAWTPKPEKPPPPRARITLWTVDGQVQISSYTCPVADAYANACKDLEAEGTGYVTVAPVNGAWPAYRITKVAE